jgi:DNA-binding NarL/FixJ family response regulator
MAKAKRKFISEFAVNLFSSRWLLIPSNQITSDGEMQAEAAKVSKNCHIYLICERPALSFEKSSFTYKDEKITGNLIHKIDGIEHKTPFQQKFPLLDEAVELRLSNYPHREVQTFDEKGECIRYLPASAISIKHQPLDFEHIFRKLKVLYVGQAFGSGNRTAIDRLRSHSTLQKILAEASYSNPDSEIMVLMIEYEPYRVFTSMDGRAKEAIRDERDGERFISIIENPLKQGQQISLAEAALIRYFQPKYNKIYKKKFPSRELKVLAQCYEYDFSALAVEINTDELHFSLYSDTVQPKMHHIANIDLVDHEQRAGFFHMATGNGENIKVTEAIGSLQNMED